MERKEDAIAFIKYQGNLIEEGYFDAKKAGETLIGIDESLRYFISKANPEIEGFEYELPIRVKKGSWENLLPSDENKYILYTGVTLAAWLAKNYFGTALEEMAKKDFKDKGIKDVVKKGFSAMMEVIKLAKHLGTLAKKKFENVEFNSNNQAVKVTNDKGEVAWVHIDIIEFYVQCPNSIFNKISKHIEKGRELQIGFNDTELITPVIITTQEKNIFAIEKIDDEIVLPELKHSEYVELEGRVTRGNETANTIGFMYEGHIITCYPEKGNIKKHKNKMFSNCRLKGYVDRENNKGEINEKRPRIMFTSIINLDKDNQTKLKL